MALDLARSGETNELLCVYYYETNSDHYAIRCAKRNNTKIIRTKLADMLNSKDFWKELQKIDLASKSTSNTVDQAVGPEQITEKLYTKYEELFNTVPTSDSEVEKLQKVLADNISFDTRITPDIVRFCVGKLKPHKDYGKYGFKSDHFINSTNKLFTVLSVMFNNMLAHGCNPLSYQYPKTVGVHCVK